MNSELGTVPNDSGTAGARGRKPRATDLELEAIVRGLVGENGQLPTLDEIVTQSGGCQRARAVAARRAVANQQLQDNAAAQLQLPQIIETRHRELLSQWISAARQIIRPIVDAAVQQSEEQLASLEDSLRDARSLRDQLQSELDTAQNLLAQVQSDNQKLRGRVDRFRVSEARWKATAVERLLTITELRSRYET